MVTNKARSGAPSKSLAAFLPLSLVYPTCSTQHSSWRLGCVYIETSLQWASEEWLLYPGRSLQKDQSGMERAYLSFKWPFQCCFSEIRLCSAVYSYDYVTFAASGHSAVSFTSSGCRTRYFWKASSLEQSYEIEGESGRGWNLLVVGKEDRVMVRLLLGGVRGWRK